MHPSLELVDRFDELLTRRDATLPYDFQTLFQTGGFRVRRASQKRLALLKGIDDQVRAMLHPGERVRFLTQAVAHSFWEAYWGGLPMYYLNRRALVLTTERLLLLQIDSRRHPRALRAQVRLGGISTVKRTGFGNTLMKLASGERHVFVKMPARDRKALVALLTEHAAAPDPVAGHIENLCPFCHQPVADHPVECPACRGRFKSWHTAGVLSLLFPGVGAIYLGLKGVAALEMIVAVLIWLEVVAAVAAPDPRNPLTPAQIAVTAASIVLFVHGLAALLTFHMARKGHYPAQAARTV